MTEVIQHKMILPEELAGLRLDQAAAALFSDYSRARLQSWIKSGALSVNGEQKRPKDKVFQGDEISLQAELTVEVASRPEPMSLDVVYQDDSLIVIDKPAGLVVHPAAGNTHGTLLNGLLHAFPELASLPRAGIVHRLDKDTTGLMVVARSLTAHNSLVTQLQERSVSREYEAMVFGRFTGGGSIDLAIGRHPQHRQKMAVVNVGGKAAITHYRVLKQYPSHAHVAVKLETGRTHQIRVHMAHRHHPLVGDSLYGGRLKVPAGCGEAFREVLRSFPRQALHAKRLALIHPESGQEIVWESDLPLDFQSLLAAFDQQYSQL